MNVFLVLIGDFSQVFVQLDLELQEFYEDYYRALV